METHYRYFIACVLKGPVAEYHRALVKEIATTFDLEASRGLIPSHVTFKTPFDATMDQIGEVKSLLATFSHSAQSSSFAIDGFGHLGRSLAALDILPSEKMDRTVKNLQRALKQHSWITWGNHEPIFHFHVTAVKHLDERFDEVWQHLQGKEPPHFDCTFDEVALLRFHNGTWVVDRVYPLNF